jgi:subtilisin family serine protease
MNSKAPLDLVKLTALMERSSGSPEMVIGLIDGPVAMNHADLASAHLLEIPGRIRGSCAQAGDAACRHGTFVAGILCAKRSSVAPAICPNCTLLVRPIFAETPTENGHMVSATPTELAAAIIESIEAGARVLNLSAALGQPSSTSQRNIEEALDYAIQRGVILVAASGNQGALGSSAITRHPWVIPVAAYDLSGRPMTQSNLGRSIGRQGLGAPGDNITSLGAEGTPLTFGGTSAAAPFVTGAVALLWSAFPAATAADVKVAVTHASASRRTAVVPPLLDAWAAYHILRKSQVRR